jgi:hypothetical protein
MGRNAVPVALAILTNQHDERDQDGTRLPIDEVLGWTDSPQTAMDFLTVANESLDAWLDLFVPVEKRPSVPIAPRHVREQQVLEFVSEKTKDFAPNVLSGGIS